MWTGVSRCSRPHRGPTERQDVSVVVGRTIPEHMALDLIASKYEIEAYLLILATWNFARFRFVTRSFDLKRFRNTIERISPIFKRLAGERLASANLDSIAKDISDIYLPLKELVGQTGASKIMHFKEPELFVMWDMGIRRHYRIPKRCSAEDYLDFL